MARIGLVGLAALAALVMGGGRLASSDREPDWGDAVAAGQSPTPSQQACRAVRGKEIPAAHLADAQAAAASLKDCDAEALYYGIGRPADVVAARRCAILHSRTTGGEAAGLFDGDELLMTIYANGSGVARDLDLAIKLSCGLQAAPFEHDGRVASLLARKTGDDETPFHYCQDITSGYAMGWCARHEQRFAIARREADIARLTAGLTPTGETVFVRLREAAAAYAEARAFHETDLSGTARGAFAVESEEAVWTDFMDLLGQVAAGGRLAGDAGEAKAADVALNAAYRERLAGSFDDQGSITADGIRQAERAWIRYRDAWLAFVRAAHPEASEDGVNAHLTRERTKALQTLGDQ